MIRPKTKTCLQCNTTFTPSRKGQKFHSHKCGAVFRRRKGSESKDIVNTAKALAVRIREAKRNISRAGLDDLLAKTLVRKEYQQEQPEVGTISPTKIYTPHTVKAVAISYIYGALGTAYMRSVPTLIGDIVSSAVIDKMLNKLKIDRMLEMIAC